MRSSRYRIPFNVIEGALMSRTTETQHAPVPNQTDVVIVGAGFGGMYMLHRAARPRVVCDRLRCRGRRRRHLVLEPLSGRPLRRGKHAVFLLVLRGAAAGMAMERGIRRPAGNSAIRQSRRRPTGPPPRHAVRNPGDRSRFRRSNPSLDRAHRSRRHGLRPLLRDGDRLPVGGADAGFPRPGQFQGQDLPHRPLAA